MNVADFEGQLASITYQPFLGHSYKGLCARWIDYNICYKKLKHFYTTTQQRLTDNPVLRALKAERSPVIKLSMFLPS